MSKHWRLVVSDLSGETVHSDSVVEADNWITALRAGRKQLGEDGAVPTGSSVNVGPGTWTVLDAVGQRRFEVSTTDNPGGAEGAKPSAAEASSGDSAAPKKKRNATMAYIPADAVKAAREAVAEQNAENAEEPEAAGAGEAAAQDTSKATAKTTSESAAPDNAIGGWSPAPSTPPPAAAEPEAESGTCGDLPWTLIASRDEDPAESNPLIYRERAFAVAPGTSEEQATSLLEDRLGALLEAAKALPKGRYFNLAVFDHRWTERPQRPPIATLQSKDWKDGPTLAYPLRSVRASIAPPAPDFAPAKTEAAKTEAAKTEAAKTESAKTESAKTEAAKTEAAKTEAAKTEPAKTEPAKTEAAKTEPAKTEPAKTEAAKTEAAKTEPAKIKRSFDGDPNARLAEAFEACQDLFFLESSADALGFAVELLDELMPSAAASACIYDIDADELRFVVTTGPGAASRQGEAIARKGLFGAATNVVGNTLRAERSDDRFEADLDGRPEPAGDHLLYVPLSQHGRLLGALQFFNEDAFSDSDAALALYVGNQLSSFLHQARMR